MIVLRASFLLIGAAALLLWQLVYVNEEAVQAYDQLMQLTHAPQKDRESYQATQARQNVIKTILLADGQERLHLQIKAKTAQLLVDKQEGHIDWLERMQNVDCIIQEELFYILADGKEATRRENGNLTLRGADQNNPSSWIHEEGTNLIPMQIIRWVQAEKAFYSYFTNRLTAEKVNFFRYRLPGHLLIFPSSKDQALVAGTANSASFSLAKEINFQADQMKASFFSAGKP